MEAELIVVPYVLGREGVGMGAGPLALNRQVAHAVAAARARGALPVVLTGNCHTQQAVVAGAGRAALASSGSTATPTSTRPRRPRPGSSTGPRWR